MMLVIFSEALGAGQTFADKHGYRLESSRPQITLLGADPVVPGAFADISRHDGIAPGPGVLIVRPDAPASGRPAGPG